MSKTRMVKTTLWRKSHRFRSLNPLDRYLYLFLITNEDVELSGAYEMPMDEIAHQTGIDARSLPGMLDRLASVDLARYVDGYVVIPRYIAVHNASNMKVRKGIESSIAHLPEHIRAMVQPDDDESDVSSCDIDVTSCDIDVEACESIGHACDSDNSNSNSNANANSKNLPAGAGPSDSPTSIKPPVPMEHHLDRAIDAAFLAEAEYVSYGRERKAVKLLRQWCEREGGDATQTARTLLETFAYLRERGDPFFRQQPWTPSALLSIAARVWRMREVIEAKERAALERDSAANSLWDDGDER